SPHPRALRTGAGPRPVRLRACLFLAPRFHRVRPLGGRVARESGPIAGPRVPADADLVVPVPDSGVAAAIGYADDWSFYIFSGGGSADELFFRDFDPEFFQEVGVFVHFLA